MRVLFRMGLVLVLFCAPLIAHAAPITQTCGPFDVTFYNDGDTDGYETGEGNWTPEQMADVSASVQSWASYISDTPARQVQMHAFWNELDSYGPDVLGGSGSYTTADGTTQWTLGEYVWREGIDPGTTTYGFDTIIQYDITAAGVSWNFGADSPTGSEIDFRSVIAHEIGHSLGWSSTYDDYFDDWGWFISSYEGLTEWDKNLVDSLGNKPYSGGVGTPDNFNELDNPVYWDGTNAINLYDGLVPIYAPSSYSLGSSLSHLDEGLLGSYLMSPAIATSQMIRSVSDLEWAMMTDMGWTIVPEPLTVLLLGLPSLFLWRKRRD